MKSIGFYGEEFFSIKEGNQALHENITRLLLTVPGERVMSNFGCRLKQYLFESTNVLREDVEADIRKSLQRYEPRVDIEELRAEVIEDNKARITLRLINKETLEPFDYDRILRF